ncbi:hypothetical protein O5833_26975 [Escherichia coli]|nr:hypothetical protein [Escherichia coli]
MTRLANYCRRHTVTRVRVDVVRTEARFKLPDAISRAAMTLVQPALTRVTR